MKITCLITHLFAGTLMTSFSWGASSRIEHVELYPSGAMVSRSVETESTGEGSLVVEVSDLPSTLLASSIQIAAVGDADLRIGGFRFLANENPVKDDDERTEKARQKIAQIMDTLRMINLEITTINERIAYYNVVAQSIRMSLQEAASPEALELSRQAWSELETVRFEGDTRRAELETEKKELGYALKEAQKELNDIVAGLSRQSGVLRFNLRGDLTGGAQLRVRYQVREAGWMPVHEIRAVPATGRVAWLYKARIHQNTGEDWDSVRVSLNSASALNAGGLPDLNPLFLSRMEAPPPVYQRAGSMREEQAVLEVSRFTADAAEEAVPESTTTGFHINLSETLTLESGKDPLVKEAFTGNLEAEFWSEAVPELSTEAWLMAGMTNELGWPILAGEAYCYIDGQLVSRLWLETMAAGEEIEMALGRNEKIAIERKERVKKESEGGLIDRTKRHAIKYETSVENRMPVAHRVVLQDRFPIGRDNKIQVKIESPKNVEPEEGTGIFKWEKTLEPGTKDVLITEYTVTYPAEWMIYPPLK